MTAATLDTLSGGRFRLGLGVSGPQVSEGWHGVRFDKPLARTREYVEIVRHGAAPARRCAYEGEHCTLPLPDGPGKALRLTVHPARERHPDLPRRGRPEEPRAGRRDRRRLAGHLLRARARRRATLGHDRGPAGRRPGQTLAGFDVVPTVPVVDRRRRCEACADAGPRLRRAVRRRHGQPRAELLQPARPSGWATRTRPPRSRTSTSPAAPGRGRRRAVRVHRPDLAARPAGADRRAAAGLRRGRGDHARPSRRTPATLGASGSRRCARWPSAVERAGLGE